MNAQQQQIATFYKENSWVYWQPLEIMARLAEETGEVARAINHLHGSKKGKPLPEEQSLPKEVGDVLYTLACLCNREGLDMDACFAEAIERSHKKDFGLKKCPSCLGKGKGWKGKVWGFPCGECQSDSQTPI